MRTFQDISEQKEGKTNQYFISYLGTSIGAINAALLVSYVKENKTWEGSGERLVDFGNIFLHSRLLKTYLTLLLIGILGVN